MGDTAKRCRHCGGEHQPDFDMPRITDDHHLRARKLADMVTQMSTNHRGTSTGTMLMTAGYLLRRASSALNVPSRLWAVVGAAALQIIDEHEDYQRERAERAKRMD